MRNLKITFFFVSIIALLTGCQAESIATEQSIHDYGMSQKYISLEEMKANDGAYTTLKKIIENSDISRTARSKYYEDYNFFVNTDKILFIEHGDYNSYTFPVFRLPDNGKTENLVLSLEADGTYTAALYTYTLTQQEKIALETGAPTLISDKIARTKLRIDPHDFFQRGILVSYTEVIVIPCGSGEHGAHNFGAWGNCTVPVKAQILVITRYLTVDDGLPDFLGWTEGGEYSGGNFGGGNQPYNPNIPPFDPSRDMDLIAGHFTQPILNLPTDEQNFFNNDLNDDQRRAMNNEEIRSPILLYLSQNEYSATSREFAAALLTVYSRDSELAMDILNLMETDSELAREMAITISEGGDADILRKIIYDSSFVNTETECIHNKLKNNPSNIYSSMLNNFNTSTGKNLTFKIGNIGTDWGITKGNPQAPNNYTITVNNSINQGSNLMKFVTLAHELIHAYMFTELESANVLTFDTNGDAFLNVTCSNSNTNINTLTVKDRFELLICAMNQAGT